MFDRYERIAKKEIKKENIDTIDKTISYVEKVLNKMDDATVLRVYHSTIERGIKKPNKSCNELLIIVKLIMDRRKIKYE